MRYKAVENGILMDYSDILHPNRANISKDELRGKLAELYKANKDQVNVFGLRTQFGGGKTTGFALVYDSPEALKKFEPHYRLVRVGVATKIEKPSRQQRTSNSHSRVVGETRRWDSFTDVMDLQASNARTDKRLSEVRQRSRVRRRRRRRKRSASWCMWEMEALGLLLDLGMGFMFVRIIHNGSRYHA
jgi:ribosomal protein S24E